MKDEKKLQIKVLIRLLIVVVCAGLYAWGGMEFKWLRRFLAPAICCISCFGFSRDWRYLVQMPFMFGTLSMGYGGDTLWAKIFRRGIFGVCNGATSSIRNAWHKLWLLVGTQVVLCTGLYITFGVWNPLPSARAEETILGVIIFLIPLMSVKDYKKPEKPE